MAKVTYIAFDGTAHAVDVTPGLSVMEGAKRNGIAGIDADCGGGCSCGTCHVYVDAAWRARTGERNPIEEATLEFANGVMSDSRLSCQIKVTNKLDGLIVRMPASQR